MSDDLQDFLARAAKRRAEKAQEERGEKARSETRQARADVNSQYSDRRRERVIRLEEDEAEVVDAIMVDEPVLEARLVRESVSDQAVSAQGLANDKQRPGFGRSVTSVRSKGSVRQEATRRSARTYESTSYESASDQGLGLNSLELVQMLSRPGGIRQAFLLKEIIDRPIKRWE